MTTPFSIERAVRRENAEAGIARIREDLDTILVIPNDKLFNLASKSPPIKQMFKLADEVVKQAVRGITDIINNDGVINLDFRDVERAMIREPLSSVSVRQRAKVEQLLQPRQLSRASFLIPASKPLRPLSLISSVLLLQVI